MSEQTTEIAQVCTCTDPAVVCPVHGCGSNAPDWCYDGTCSTCTDRIATALASVGAHDPIAHGSKVRVGSKCVRVVYDPDLPHLGLTQDVYDDEGCTTVIRLRAWNERVLLHEVLHVVLDEWLTWFREQDDWRSLDHTLTDPREKVTQQIEDALWGLGWRLTTSTAGSEVRHGE